MGNSYFTLIPERVRYDQFWVEISKRNRWLILLRFGASALLSIFIIGLSLLHEYYKSFTINTTPLWIITAGILSYNFIFLYILQHIHGTNHETGFHSLHLSLLQICTDLTALILFIYFTGGVESPFNCFIIFHVIIGSLFLPGRIIRIIVAIVLLIIFTFSMMSVNGTIHQHSFEGLLPFPLYNNPEYLATFFVFLGLALYMSIYLANSIARELYQRERSLTQAKEQIENAEKTKSQYVMSVVHDLKTPIVAAMTHLDLILGGLLGPIADEQLNSLERIKVRLNGAVKTINDILYISQLKLESAIEKVEDVNIVNVLDEIYKDHRVIMKSKEIKYKLDFEQDGEYLIEAEPRLLKLALANIISNACKYTENGGKVEVQLKKIKNILLLSIADTGIGIAENEHDKIFTEFYRASGAKKKGIEGTGLGLSIVKQTVERYHGSIIVESPSKLSDDPAKPGTRFVITLPRHYSLSKDGIKLSS